MDRAISINSHYLAEKFGYHQAQLKRLYGGRNSIIWQIDLADSAPVVMKCYLGDEASERYQRETSALQLMLPLQLPVPALLAKDATFPAIVLQYIDGVIPTTISASQLEEAIAFIVQLQQLPITSLQPACDNILSPTNFITGIEQRYQQFIALSDQRLNSLLQYWLQQWQVAMASVNIKVLHSLSLSQQVATPADFSFHNSLYSSNNRLYFLDFEYFGRDDPMRVVADWIWHPGMELSQCQIERIEQGVFLHVANAELVWQRYRQIKPLFGLRWALILLNEFLSDKILIRRQVMAAEDIEQLQQQQLRKAQCLLQKVEEFCANDR